MNKNNLNLLNVVLSIAIISTSFLSAQGCVDDATGAYTTFGGCATVINTFGQTCDATFPADGSVVVGTECPVTCNMCPGVCGDGIYDWDETGSPCTDNDSDGFCEDANGDETAIKYCPEDIPGCDLSDLRLSISDDGLVLFKSSVTIAGFQFYVEGGTVNSASGGSAEDAGLDVSTNSTSGKVLGFSMDGYTIDPGCGILTELNMTGTPTGITDDGSAFSPIFSSSSGADLGFSYEGSLSIFQYSSNIPSEFTISQNYPNPFNPRTSIAFDVTEINEISLIVYDLSGKEIITLASGTFIPGSYRVNWDAVNNYGDAIASGMYVYRYVSGNKAITRKMLYLK